MHLKSSTWLAPLLLSPFMIAGCATDAGSSEGEMYVVSCTLACTDGQGDQQVFCSIINTYQNQEISILFSEPLDIFSVNSNSFRVTNVSNGTSPPGQYFGDPTNPHRLIFRPSLAFDENGSPIFGFESGASYRIMIPGEVHGDDPPFIHSLTGHANRTRMECIIQTTEGIIDPVPGHPSVTISADVVTGYDENDLPDDFDQGVEITADPEVTDVWRETQLTFFFDDVMNISTLLDPASGNAPYIVIEVDPDGDLTTSDRFNVDGSYSFSVDLERLETTLIFDTDLPFPSAGPDAPLQPRRIVITVPSSVQDLVANSVASGGGTRSFITELSKFTEVTLPEGGEDFVVSWPSPGSNEDGPRGGAFWGGGQLTPGIGGGSGRLGDLFVPNGISVVLNTDNQTFPLTAEDGFFLGHIPDIIGNPDPVGFPDTLGNYPDSSTVTDGVFEFNSLVVEAGGSLRFEGLNPARVYVRGPVSVVAGGLIDLSGVTPEDHESSVVDPASELPTPTNAAGGADGGFGATRFHMAQNIDMLALLECENDPVEVLSMHTNGFNGGGVGRLGVVGGGVGGVRYPGRYPITNTATTADNNDHDIAFTTTTLFDPFTSDTECRSMMVGGSGSGGAYATPGGIGVAQSIVDVADSPVVTNNAPDTPGGDAGDVGLEDPAEDNVGYSARLLRWFDGFLRGGSAGGGGGGHPYGTWADGQNGGSLFDCIGATSNFHAWIDHSGSRGGFGGGAIQLTSGKRISLSGSIDASGGSGGEPRHQAVPDECDFDFGRFATPGGGGSGGAIKLQSIVVDLAPAAGVLNVQGGAGGTAKQWALSQGGAGGTGLVRIEDIAGLITRQDAAPSILPFDAADDSLGWVSVDNGQDPDDGPGWRTPLQRPGSITGSSSCWLAPNLPVFSMFFPEDAEDEDSGDPAAMGWNMTVLYQPPGQPEQDLPFRGLNSFFMQSWENEFGRSLGTQGGTVSAAPIVVRFQGARTTGSLDPCDLDINDPTAPIVPGSITPWVAHPAELNTFQPPANMIRFVIIFDNTRVLGDTPSQILSQVNGVTDFWVRALPD